MESVAKKNCEILMITCDVFELQIESSKDATNQILRYLLYTDLPAGTLVLLDCFRTYLDWNDDECIWAGNPEEMAVVPGVLGDYNGLKGSIDVLATDKAALQKFFDRAKDSLSGIRTSVSDELTVRFFLGASQRIRAFGKNNCNVEGAMVFEDEGVKIAEVSETLFLAMNKDLQPIDVDATD